MRPQFQLHRKGAYIIIYDYILKLQSIDSRYLFNLKQEWVPDTNILERNHFLRRIFVVAKYRAGDVFRFLITSYAVFTAIHCIDE